jgi:hypothetical protein
VSEVFDQDHLHVASAHKMAESLYPPFMQLNSGLHGEIRNSCLDECRAYGARPHSDRLTMSPSAVATMLLGTTIWEFR